MRHRRMTAPVMRLMVAAVLLAALTGCGSDGLASEATARKGDKSSSASPGSAASPSVLVDARTVADQKNPTCSAPTADTVTVTLYSPVVTADGAVTIRGARAVGDAVRLLDSEGAVVVGDPHNVGSGMSVTWPFEDRRGDGPIDESTRTAFVGMSVDDGQSVLPLWRLTFDPDSHLRGLEIDYDDGTGNVETLFVKMDATYARELKGC